MGGIAHTCVTMRRVDIASRSNGTSTVYTHDFESLSMGIEHYDGGWSGHPPRQSDPPPFATQRMGLAQRQLALSVAA